MQQQIEALEEGAKEASTIRLQLADYQAQIKVLQDKPNYQRRTIDIVKEVTVRLPENTWLNQLRIASNQVQITGFSTKASAVIEQLDKAPMFENTRFTSPLANNKQAQQAFKVKTTLIQNP